MNNPPIKGIEGQEEWNSAMRDTISSTLFGVNSSKYGTGVVEEAAVAQMKIVEASLLQALVGETEGKKKSADETMGKAGEHYAGYIAALSDTMATIEEALEAIESKNT